MAQQNNDKTEEEMNETGTGAQTGGAPEQAVPVRQPAGQAAFPAVARPADQADLQAARPINPKKWAGRAARKLSAATTKERAARTLVT